MATSSEDASNAISSALEPKVVNSGGKDEISAPETAKEVGSVEEDGVGSAESGDQGSLPGEDDQQKTLHYAGELLDKGVGLRNAGDYASAVDCLSRALEIHVAHYGEYAPECAKAYHEYGRTLFYKAQEEDDKEDRTSLKSGENGEGSSTPATDDKQDCISSHGVAEPEEDEEANEDEDMEKDDEDEDDLDRALKLMNVARAIITKILQAPAPAPGMVVLRERGALETSLRVYKKLVSKMEGWSESRKADTDEFFKNFRMSLALKLRSMVDEAERLKNDLGVVVSPTASRLKKKGILSELLIGLEKQQENVHQATEQWKSKLSTVTQACSRFQSGAGIDYPTVSTGATSGAGGSTVADLGVVRRGIKRANVKPINAEPAPKNPPLE